MIKRSDPTDAKRLLFISREIGKRGNYPRVRRILFIRLMAITKFFSLNKEEKHLVNRKTYRALMRGHYPYALDVVKAVKRERAVKEILERWQSTDIAEG